MRNYFLLFFVFFLSCSENKDISHLKIFKYNEISGINSLDPAFSKDLASVWATSQLFNGDFQDYLRSLIPNKIWLEFSQEGFKEIDVSRIEIFLISF